MTENKFYEADGYAFEPIPDLRKSFDLTVPDMPDLATTSYADQGDISGI